MYKNQDYRKLVDLDGAMIRPVLDRLLRDMTTGKNIMFCTNDYADEGFGSGTEITTEALSKVDIVPRCEKAAAVQASRARRKAEIYTPARVVNQMANMMNNEIFKGPEMATYETNDERLWASDDSRPNDSEWRGYVDSTFIEPACGEGAFLTMRYDAPTGERITPTDRGGILDRKLKAVRKYAKRPEEKLEWALRALRACYGFEWAGDSLLLARANILLAFCEFCCREGIMDSEPDAQLLATAADIICWNLWQMDGLKGTVPETDQECQVKNWLAGGRQEGFWADAKHDTVKRPARGMGTRRTRQASGGSRNGSAPVSR